MEPGSPDPRPGARGVEKELKPEVVKPISPCGLKEGEVWASAPFSNVRVWALTNVLRHVVQKEPNRETEG